MGLRAKEKSTFSYGRRCGLQLALFVYVNCPRNAPEGFVNSDKCSLRNEAKAKLVDRGAWTYEKREAFDEETDKMLECDVYAECCQKACDKTELEVEECW